MNKFLDELRSLDTSDVGRWPFLFRALFIGLIFVFVALTGMNANQVASLNLIVSLHGLVAAIAMWFAFQPPAFYARWLESRAHRHADAAPRRLD